MKVMHRYSKPENKFLQYLHPEEKTKTMFFLQSIPEKGYILMGRLTSTLQWFQTGVSTWYGVEEGTMFLLHVDKHGCVEI